MNREEKRQRNSEARKRYERSEKGKHRNRRYNHSAKKRALISQYNKSQSHRNCQRRYRESGKEAMATKKYRDRPDVHAKAKGTEFLRDKDVQTTRTETRNGNYSEVTLYGLEKPVRNDEELIKASDMDMTRWKLVSFTNKTYSAWIKNKDNKIETKQLWSAHGRYELDRDQILERAWAAEIEQRIKSWKPVLFTPLRQPKGDSGNLLVISLYDHHFGKLAWSKETGHADYDLSIARKLWDDATDDILTKAKPYSPDEILFVVGQDLMHFDSKKQTTFNGTQMDSDTRYAKMYAEAYQAVMRTTEKCRQVGRMVRIKGKPGNHDEMSSFHLVDKLQAVYGEKNAPDVVIENELTPRIYYEWGNVMVMVTHGNLGKLDNYPQVMAAEKPEMWGRTKFKEVHTGDKHQRLLRELHGVAVRIMPTLCPPDAWHSDMNFVGNLQMSEALIFNKQAGHIGSIFHTWQ
jgi:hypothetical protein